MWLLLAGKYMKATFTNTDYPFYRTAYNCWSCQVNSYKQNEEFLRYEF